MYKPVLRICGGRRYTLPHPLHFQLLTPIPTTSPMCAFDLISGSRAATCKRYLGIDGRRRDACDVRGSQGTEEVHDLLRTGWSTFVHGSSGTGRAMAATAMVSVLSVLGREDAQFLMRTTVGTLRESLSNCRGMTQAA